jgi:hypothetical protein
MATTCSASKATRLEKKGKTMIKNYNEYVFYFLILLLPAVATVANEPTKAAHKPPILTTTAIIEVYNQDQFQGIVLIERGKAPYGMSREEAIRDSYPGWIKTQQVCPVKPLEKDFVPSLISLQNRGVIVMGLTHRQPSVAHSTVRQIASLGFDFIKTALSTDCLLSA